MKIRIQDNSVRLRLTLKELEDFAREGGICRWTTVLGMQGPVGEFVYSLEHDSTLGESEVRIEGSRFRVRLNDTDRAELLLPDREGVYLRREWTAPGGGTTRFMAMVEKDRPGSTCVKKEEWIYNAPPNGPVETRPIPRPAEAT